MNASVSVFIIYMQRLPSHVPLSCCCGLLRIGLPCRRSVPWGKQLQQFSRERSHVCRCYLRLVDNPRAKEALKAYLPKALLAAQFPFREAAESDTQLKQLLTQLRTAVGIKDGLQMEQPPMHAQAQVQQQAAAAAAAQQGSAMDRSQMGAHGAMMQGLHQPAMSMAYSAFQPMNFRR